MILINKPYIEKRDTFSRINCEICFDDRKDILWFEVDEKYSEYLCLDRADAYVVGLLHYAMSHNEDIICELPVTENLLYNINEILIPSLTRYAKTLHLIEVKAKKISPLMKGEHVGTGCSCGIDSFSSIFNHLNSDYSGMDIDYLCLNNVGAYNKSYNEYGRDKVQRERFEITKLAANDIGLQLLESNSNYADFLKQNHYYTHTYAAGFAIYMLQKFWKIYYYASSGVDFSNFSIVNNDVHACGYYDLLTLQCFSIPGLTLYSDGGNKTRLEKTKEILNFTPAQKYLYVCLKKSNNCSVCSKCKRTLVTLDLFQCLDDFSDVFDIDYYKKHRNQYYRWLYLQHLKKDDLNEPVYFAFKNEKRFKKALFGFSLFIYLKFKLKKLIIYLLPEKMINFIKEHK